MVPGIIGGPPFPKHAMKDAIVAVASNIHPSVPMVVGVCEIDVSALQEVQGVKGRALHTIHSSGDEIWSWQAAGNSGRAPPDHLNGWLADDEDIHKLQNGAENLALHDDHADEKEEGGGGVPLPDHDVDEDDEDDGRDFATIGMMTVHVRWVLYSQKIQKSTMLSLMPSCTA